VAGAQRAGFFVGDFNLSLDADALDAGWRPYMVENGLDAGKTVNAHYLFMIKVAVWLAELGMPLVGQFA
jgi:hypothetical protein